GPACRGCPAADRCGRRRPRALLSAVERRMHHLLSIVKRSEPGQFESCDPALVAGSSALPTPIERITARIERIARRQQSYRNRTPSRPVALPKERFCRCAFVSCSVLDSPRGGPSLRQRLRGITSNGAPLVSR